MRIKYGVWHLNRKKTARTRPSIQADRTRGVSYPHLTTAPATARKQAVKSTRLISSINMFVVHHILEQGAAGEVMTRASPMDHGCKKAGGPRMSASIELHTLSTTRRKSTNRKSALIPPRTTI